MTNGGFVFVYPNPAYVTVIADIVPTPDTVATAVAFVDVVPIPAVIVPIPAVTPIETFGATVYPDPPFEIRRLLIFHQFQKLLQLQQHQF